jgi:hypothetical protein
LQLALLAESVSRNFGKKRLTGAVFLDVAKAFDIALFNGLICKLMALIFPSYLVKTILFYLRGRTFKASFQASTFSRRFILAGLAPGELISPVLFSLHVNGMPVLFHHAPQASAACQLPGSLPR